MLRRLLLAAMATLGSLLFVEMVVRIVLPSPGLQPFPRGRPLGLLVPHESRGYAYAPAFAGTITTPEYQIELATNSLGLRDDPVAAGEHIEVLAVGDSFTVGFGVEAEDAWPSRLESHLAANTGSDRGARVLNAGVSGYGLRQIRQITEEFLSLDPELVVLGLYPSRYRRLPNPFTYFEGYAVRRKRLPHLAVTDEGLLYSAFNDARIQRVHRWFMVNFHTGAYVLEAVHIVAGKLYLASHGRDRRLGSSAERLQPLLDELARIHELCERRDVTLVVLLVNHQKIDGSFAAIEHEYNSIVVSFAADRGIAVFDPLPLFEASASGAAVFRLGNDHHWSARAHSLVAKGLSAFLLREGYGRP